MKEAGQESSGAGAATVVSAVAKALGFGATALHNLILSPSGWLREVDFAFAEDATSFVLRHLCGLSEVCGLGNLECGFMRSPGFGWKSVAGTALAGMVFVLALSGCRQQHGAVPVRRTYAPRTQVAGQSYSSQPQQGGRGVSGK